MITTMHVATGAAIGSLVRRRAAAVLLGAAAHAVGDAVPHGDFESRAFETWSGLSLLALVAVARGPLDPATLGAAACSAPDLEHLLPLPRPGGRQLFPSHRFEGWHRPGGISPRVQLVAAAAIAALVILRAPSSSPA